ncbi:hypothetical protein [Streptomyces sp. DSM 41921]|uniref:Uncharacterized protein n=1 Tax=Streptomyces dubilierae TaxID=3075533 RepID=A0ABU2PP45_9ACTN|nr:hypothetical protein [Streptomyces sp. DSM 41921]MDT0392759.1 hypothetical protein [Streptomyces sp. DSM 41921]
MSITQQYLLDTHRARSLGAAAPPAPGTHDWRLLRAWREERRFRAVLAGRPVRHGLRAALVRWRRRPT